MQFRVFSVSSQKMCELFNILAYAIGKSQKIAISDLIQIKPKAIHLKPTIRSMSHTRLIILSRREEVQASIYLFPSNIPLNIRFSSFDAKM